jgi:hypothetical protein
MTMLTDDQLKLLRRQVEMDMAVLGIGTDPIQPLYHALVMLLDEVELYRHMIMEPTPEAKGLSTYIDTDHGRKIFDPSNPEHVMLVGWANYCGEHGWQLSWEEWKAWHNV